MGNDPTLPPYGGPSYGTGPTRHDSGSSPEVLPPGTESVSPAPPRRRRPGWAVAPATYVLIGINCAVFIAMLLARVSPLNPDPEQLLQHWGANNAGSVLYLGEWWRIVTAMFVHVGILHLATNMWCLWNLGLLAEPLMGSGGLLAVYVLTGAAGNLLSTGRYFYAYYNDWLRFHDIHVFPAGVGASGAVFGIAGALIILLKSRRLPVPVQEVKRLRRSVIYFAVINLVIGGGISFGTDVIGKGIHIDNMAHLGGVACGLLFALPMVPRLGAPRTLFDRRLRIAVTMTLMILVLFGFYLAQLPK
ncbi:MAG TPA: rhomboid family intramembrane serine protease [Terracidiphilus sp.]